MSAPDVVRLLAQTLLANQAEVQLAAQALREAEADPGLAETLLAVATDPAQLASGVALVGILGKYGGSCLCLGLTLRWAQAAAICLKNFVTRKHIWHGECGREDATWPRSPSVRGRSPPQDRAGNVPGGAGAPAAGGPRRRRDQVGRLAG